MKIIFEQPAKEVYPDTFVLEKHYYNKVINSQIHKDVSFFLNMEKNRIIERYCHLNPLVDKDYLNTLLNYKAKYINWSGTDLFHVTTEKGNKRMVVIETNSCPSGQKSMPLLNDYNEMGGYERLIAESFLPYVKEKRMIKGVYAVVYDKNEMEASGYAAALANILNHKVYLVQYFNNDKNPSVRFNNEVMEIKTSEGRWLKVCAAFRYVTQKPWNRIPVKCKTIIYNPIIACLAGGRNKRTASKAYDFFNGELKPYGLKIQTPETIQDVKIHEIPLWIERFGYQAVIKNPYSNAGQGVYTITNKKELNNFMSIEHSYDDFIIQSLIGNYQWSSTGSEGKFYHVGMIPNKKNQIYVSDLRMMIASTNNGYQPIAMYARKTAAPLKNNLTENDDSWEMLGTNLSVKLEDGWDSQIDRLKLMDRKDFTLLGLSLDNLIEGYIQSVISTIAIDKLSDQLLTSKGQLRKKLFKAINGDEILNSEIL